MRSTIIPAQVTTVEDTIAGSLNLTQILLLVSSLFINTFIYTLLPTRLAFTLYKIPLMIGVLCICIILSIRVKQRLILNWLVILATYSVRPHLYMFNKNTQILRKTETINISEEKPKQSLTPIPMKREEKRIISFDYQSFIRNPSLNIRFKRNSVQVVKNYD